MPAGALGGLGKAGGGAAGGPAGGVCGAPAGALAPELLPVACGGGGADKVPAAAMSKCRREYTLAHTLGALAMRRVWIDRTMRRPY